MYGIGGWARERERESKRTPLKNFVIAVHNSGEGPGRLLRGDRERRGRPALARAWIMQAALGDIRFGEDADGVCIYIRTSARAGDKPDDTALEREARAYIYTHTYIEECGAVCI